MARVIGSVMVMLFVHLAVAQTKPVVVTGKVSTLSEPLIGATVFEIGTTSGTVTDVNGNFSLQVPTGATIRISFIGYVPQEIKIDSSIDLDIILEEDENQLEELVVIGYGSVKKSDLTGSISSTAVSTTPPC